MPVTAPSFGGVAPQLKTPLPGAMPLPGAPTPGATGGMFGGLFGPTVGMPGAPSTTPPMTVGGASTGMENYTPRGLPSSAPMQAPRPGQGPQGGGGYDPQQANPFSGQPAGRDAAQEAADIVHRMNAIRGSSAGGADWAQKGANVAIHALESERWWNQLKGQGQVAPWAQAPIGSSMTSLTQATRPGTSAGLTAPRSVTQMQQVGGTAGGDLAFDPFTNERSLTNQGQLRFTRNMADQSRAQAEANYWAGGGNLYGPGGGGTGGTRGTGTGAPGAGDASMESLFNRASNLVGSEVPVLAREDPLRQLAPVAPEQVADRTATNARSFGRAKGQIGRMSQAALRDVRNQMTGRGISGSGIESKATTDVINAGYGRLGDVATAQAAADAETAQRVADQNYSGALTQRGQDIGQAGTQFSGDISQRGQDVTAQQASRNARLQSILSMMSQFGGRLY